MSTLFDAGFAWSDTPPEAVRNPAQPAIEIGQKALISAENREVVGGAGTGPSPTVATVATVAGWKDGLIRLGALPCPDWCADDRWRQLKADADWFAMSWADDVFRRGWSVTDVFGCSVRPWLGNITQMGLVPLLRGRSVIDVTDSTATIKNRIGDPNVFRLHSWRTAGALIWDAYSTERTA